MDDWDRITAIAFGPCGLSPREFWDEITAADLWDMYRAYQYKLLDQWELAAFQVAHIRSAITGKRIHPRKLFDRKRVEKDLFRKTPSISEIQEKARRIREIYQRQVRPWRTDE